MKALYIFNLLLLGCLNCFSQEEFTGRAIEDFRTLKKIITDSEGKLKPDENTLNSFYKKAEILGFIDAEQIKFKALTEAEKNKKNVIQGGFSVAATPAIDALGTFVSNRIKEEANIAYLNRFTDYLNNDDFNEIKLLFPESKDYFLGIKEHLYEYASLFPTIRDNFKTDLNNINIKTFADIFDDGKTFKSGFWLKANIDSKKKYFAFTFDLISSHTNGSKPIEVLDKIRNRTYFANLNTGNNESEIAFLITDLAYHSNNTQNAAEDLSKLLREGTDYDIKCFKILLLNSNSQFLKSSMWNENAIDILLPLFYKLSASWDDAKNTKDKSYNFLINLGKILKESAKLTGIDSKKAIYFTSVTMIAQGIQQKDYNSLINGIINLTIQLIDDKSTSEHDKLRKSLTFIANVVSSKDSEGMLAALNAVALPVGSYMMKRNGRFTLSAGAFGGIAYYQGGRTAIYAPIGLNLSWGKLKGHNLGFTIPVIDVGAVTAIRLIGNNDPLPQLKWDNVLAPGIIANWGIKNTPLTLSAGWQNGPGLVEIKDNVSIISQRSTRFVVSLSFDIPIIKIYRKEN